MDNYFGRFAFIVEWYDIQASLARRYILTFYCSENSVEMFDLKNNRIFLKKCKVDDIHLRDLYIGNSINLMSRLLDVVDYADNYTRRMLNPETEKAFLIVKPDAYNKIGTIIDLLTCHGFKITRMKSFRMAPSQAEVFYADKLREMNYRQLFQHLSSGAILAMEVMKQDALKCLLKIVGPVEPERAKVEAPGSFRAMFGTDLILNAIHCPETCEKVEFETTFFFGGSNIQNSALLANTTCVVIKPHAVRKGDAGKIIQMLFDCGHEVTACSMYKLDKLNAAEFYEVYKGVVSDYQGMVDELCRSPCIALEVKVPALPCCGGDGKIGGGWKEGGAVMSVRDFVGPVDPDLARKLRPNTMRAAFGESRLQNAVHVTDLIEDSFIELEYFFRILDS